MVRLSALKLRTLITLARLQDFKGWEWVHPTDIPPALPSSLSREFSAAQAIQHLELLRELELVKRRRARERIAIERSRKQVVVEHEYALSQKGNEMAAMLFTEGLPRWIDR